MTEKRVRPRVKWRTEGGVGRKVKILRKKRIKRKVFKVKGRLAIC